jgi:hypothetical protein
MMCGNWWMPGKFKWKVDWNLSGKKETTNRYRCVQLSEQLNLIERKKQAEQTAWIPDQRWRDLMEWLGDFNRKLDGAKF